MMLPDSTYLTVGIVRQENTTTIVGKEENGLPLVIGGIPKLSVEAVREAILNAIEGVITSSGGESAYDNPCSGGRCTDPEAHAEGGHDF
jgi:hypothetical protein